ATAQILQYYNDYFGVAYPLPKLDQIALPGGFGGAMENWGGITYYESTLLFDPKNSSADTKQNIYEVLAHEMAHQWFGDLVTMAWWDNLWLNEGFASWMGTKCTAHFNPQCEVWRRRNLPRDPTRRDGIAAGWTEQPGFPLVRVKREAEGKVRLTQERFAVNFKNAPPLQWKIPLTYSLVGEAPATLLMTSKIGNLQNIPADRALKLNVNGAGNYRVEYDEPSWNLLLEALPKLGVEDRVNLLSDAWALVQPDRASVSLYFGLVEKLPPSTELAEREQIINVLDFINRLFVGSPEREKFQRYAQ